MKEDQTQLITARLQHLQFMMESGHMPIFRHRSDMFLFALEAHNIARGLSSRYYRLQEDLDIRFFVRFRFDYWLEELQKWIKQLGGDEYRVKDDNMFAEGRAKRLTIVIDRLFGYHLDRLPEDSAEGSMPLPNNEILEPLKAIGNMKSVDLVKSFREALREVHAYLLKLAMLPIEWPEKSRRKALQMYLNDALQTAHVQTELTNYRYFCHMPDAQSVKSQFCYLRQRLEVLSASGELKQMNLAKSDQDELLRQLCGLFDKDETNPSEDQIPSNVKPMADDELFTKFLYFVNLDAPHSFPVLDEDKISNYLIRKDVFLNEEQEKNLQTLFALAEAMNPFFAPILERRGQASHHGSKMRKRIETVMKHVKMYNSKLTSLLSYGHTIEDLDAFFERLFSVEWREEFGEAQDDLLTLFEKGREDIKLETYVHLLRIAFNLKILMKKTGFGKEIYKCLKGEPIIQDANEDTVNTYFTKTGYKKEANWQKAILLVQAVEKEYKQA